MMHNISLECGYGSTMDIIDVKYDLENEDGVFYLTPVQTLTQNGAIEIREKGGHQYLSGGVPIVFMITGETEGNPFIKDDPFMTDSSFITKEAVLEAREPRLEYSITGRKLLFKVYNTRHFYLSGGIGRIEAAENAEPYFVNGDFYFKVEYNLPQNFTVTNNLLKAICLPVVNGGKASVPYCIEIKI